MFIHEPYEFVELESTTGADGNRHYTTPEGNQYASVTTILGRKKNPALDEWRARVGALAADKHTKQSANRGTNVHAIYEDFVQNKLNIDNYDPFTYSLFKSSVPILQGGLTKVHNLEFALYSDILKTAGRCDLLCEWFTEKAILDYKTSKRAKRKEWIEDYFIQTCLYAMMVYELIGVRVKKLVVFIVNETDPDPQVFVEDVKDWIQPAIKRVKDYR